MMDMVQIAGFAIVGCCLVLLLRQQRPEFALLLSVAVGILLLLSCMPDIQVLMGKMQEISALSAVDEDVLAVVFKVIGLVYITEFAAGVCKDAKEEAMALKIQIAGKVAILGFALPLMLEILQVVEDMLV